MGYQDEFQKLSYTKIATSWIWFNLVVLTIFPNFAFTKIRGDMKKYTKPALDFQAQIELLKCRGLRIDDEKRAIRHLSNVSYYRLSAYMLPFKKLDAQGEPTDTFALGTSWDDIYNLYKFDRKLRLLVFDAIERIEIALRTQVIYQLSHKYGSHWQNNPNIFKPARKNHRTGKIYDVYRDIQNHINEQLSATTKLYS